MTATLFDNPCYSPLFEDTAVTKIFSPETAVKQWLKFECGLVLALQAAGVLDADTAQRAIPLIRGFQPDMRALGQGTLADGLPIPEFVRQLKAHVGDGAVAGVHVGATSQDLLDTSLALNLRDLSDLLADRITGIIAGLQDLKLRCKSRPLMGRTRMQAALPITVADRVDIWMHPLGRHLERLAEIRPRVELLQFGGPVGTRMLPAGDGNAVARMLADHIGLACPAKAWHAMRDGVAEYAGWLALVTGSLGKMGQDICLMKQQGIDEIVLSGGGESSAMGHKKNPILAETLVTFGRFNAVQLSGINLAVLHEQERSGAAWALEWMCLPLMAQSTGKATLIAAQLITQIESIGSDNLNPC